MFSGSPTSIVVPLVVDLAYLLDEHMETICDSVDDAEAMKSRHNVWYGVLDGCQLHSAIMELIDEIPTKWRSFLWKVIIVRPTSTLEQYKKLTRVQNERSKAQYTYETTIYDLMRGLCETHDSIYNESLKKSRTGPQGAKFNHQLVAEAYDGGDHHSSTSVKQEVSVAARLSWSAIEALGQVTEMDCSDVIVQSVHLNKYSLRTRNDVLVHQDCRLFKFFVSFTALRASKTFMAAASKGLGVAQVNCIHRMRHWSELNKYKSLQPKQLQNSSNFPLRHCERNLSSFH